MNRHKYYQAAQFRRVGNTPMIEISMAVAGLTHHIILKCESANPTKSIKDREAWCMISSALEALPIEGPPSFCCSDNNVDFLIAVGFVCATHSARLSAIVRESLISRLEKITVGMPVTFFPYPNPDGHKSSIQRSIGVKEFRHIHQESVYLDDSQTIKFSYVHKEWTAKEIFDRVRDRIDLVFCTGSTGALLSGLSEYVEENRLKTGVAFIESYQSSASTPKMTSELVLQGFGSDEPFVDINWNTVRYRTKIQDRQALAICSLINEKVGLDIGPASGGTIAGALHFLAQQEDPMRVVCICNDSSRSISNLQTTESRWDQLKDDAAESKKLLESIILTAKILP